jgi:hypothetical protein
MKLKTNKIFTKIPRKEIRIIMTFRESMYSLKKDD